MIEDIQFSHNNKFIISVDRNGSITIWNPENGQQIREMENAGDKRWSLSISPNDRFVTATGALTNATHIWDINTGKIVVTYKSSKKGPIVSPVYSPDGRFIVSGEPDGVWLRDAKTAKKIKSIPELFDPTQSILLLAFSPDSHYLASTSNDDYGKGITRVIPFNY